MVAVSITSVARANERVFNKIPGFYFSKAGSESGVKQPTTSFVGVPVPVDISVSMSIVAKFQADIDQILSNFIPYANPYIILSWDIPSSFNLVNQFEIRSEVLWNGSVTLAYPNDIAASAKYKVSADTSFTIKGWLFPEAPQDPTANIFYINTNLYSSGVLSMSSTYGSLTGSTYTYPTSTLLYNDLETIAMSGFTATNTISSTIIS